MLTDSIFDQIFSRTLEEAIGSQAYARLTDETDLLSVGVDSLQWVRLIMRLEDELEIFWPIERMAEYGQFTVVGKLRQACRELVTDISA